MVKYVSAIDRLKLSAEVAILCGGEGKRLGGINKASILFHNERLVDRISRIAFPLGSPLSWVEKEPGSIDDPYQYADRKLQDDSIGGSVGAVIAALECSKKDWVWIIACDLPFIEVKHLSLLAEHVTDLTQEFVCYFWGSKLHSSFVWFMEINSG